MTVACVFADTPRQPMTGAGAAYGTSRRDDAGAEFFDAAARGELLDRAAGTVLSGEVPYVSAIVEPAEGPWLLVRLVDADPAELRVGAPLRARYVRSGPGDDPGEVLPVFGPGVDDA